MLFPQLQWSTGKKDSQKRALKATTVDAERLKDLLAKGHIILLYNTVHVTVQNLQPNKLIRSRPLIMGATSFLLCNDE